jgi:hypothetical protein
MHTAAGTAVKESARSTSAFSIPPSLPTQSKLVGIILRVS